jgi:hypothetical protein
MAVVPAAIPAGLSLGGFISGCAAICDTSLSLDTPNPISGSGQASSLGRLSWILFSRANSFSIEPGPIGHRLLPTRRNRIGKVVPYQGRVEFRDG